MLVKLSDFHANFHHFYAFFDQYFTSNRENWESMISHGYKRSRKIKYEVFYIPWYIWFLIEIYKDSYIQWYSPVNGDGAVKPCLCFRYKFKSAMLQMHQFYVRC